MSKISLEPNDSGAGTFSIVSPDSNTNRTLTLGDESGTIRTIEGIESRQNNFAQMPQVSGDPIVESGSNSDGDFVRFADGTQMVSDIIRVTDSDGDSFLARNMAKSFIDNEYKVLNGQTNDSISAGRLEASRSIMIRRGSSSQIQVRVLEPVLNNTTIQQDYTAIGKWK